MIFCAVSFFENQYSRTFDCFSALVKNFQSRIFVKRDEAEGQKNRKEGRKEGRQEERKE
jgi:hypothetical protein